MTVAYLDGGLIVKPFAQPIKVSRSGRSTVVTMSSHVVVFSIQLETATRVTN
jgi:hypothetical protein